MPSRAGWNLHSTCMPLGQGKNLINLDEIRL